MYDKTYIGDYLPHVQDQAVVDALQHLHRRIAELERIRPVCPSGTPPRRLETRSMDLPEISLPPDEAEADCQEWLAEQAAGEMTHER